VSDGGEGLEPGAAPVPLVRDRGYSSWGSGPAVPDEFRPPPRRSRKGLWIALTAAGLAGVVALVAAQASGSTQAPPGADPTPSVFRDAAPLGSPAPVPATTGPLRFLYRQDDGSGRPVAWDPCFPIHVVERVEGAPDGGAALLRQALGEITRLTGLQLVVDGETEEEPSRGRDLYERNSSVYAPVLIAWATEADNADLTADVEGYTEPLWIRDRHVPGSRRYATGQVVLDADDLGVLLLDHHGKAEARSVILHELGHLVGLAHVHDTHELMSPEQRRRITDFGPGDRHGLAQLGTGRCFIS
jgi:hypothetical protein